ncbi:MAG: hypothetical protein M3342_03035 [Bacteroidota bacterium]|nr:hypothetical protein [Flavisolibacter sp.]MBD0350145.1 hypothetical protein [Flavisolibacter sp.]MBD0365158.1 hypothetical protein [Flavisolibacter sp.]MDQ3842974.1 hypothetical protein [Bacteroidota bacterium]
MPILSILIAAILLFALLMLYLSKHKNNKCTELHYLYEEAKRKGNKAQLLEAGIRYYTILRGGELTDKNKETLEKEALRIANDTDCYSDKCQPQRKENVNW